MHEIKTGEKNLDKLKKIFSKEYVAAIIDLLYGITSIQKDYYSVFVGFIGAFYLFELFPNGQISKIWGQIPQGLMEEVILSGLFSKTVIVIFLMYEGIRAIILVFGQKGNFETINEIIVGSILVTLRINIIPIITLETVLMYFCFFVLLKLVLKSITKIFKISTRHFGYFMEMDCPPSGKAISKEI